MSDAILENVVDLEEQDIEDSMHGKFLVFMLDEQEYAIAIKYVVDIINVQPMTRVPNVPDFVKGITNLRGKVIPIVDVRIRFGKSHKEYNDRTCIIVVELDDMQVGLVIDQVAEVITLDDDDIAPPPAFNQSPEYKFIQGIGKAENGIKLLLDCKTVLSDMYVDEMAMDSID